MMNQKNQQVEFEDLMGTVEVVQSQQIKRSNRLCKGCESLNSIMCNCSWLIAECVHKGSDGSTRSHRFESDHSGKNQYNFTTIESNNDGFKKLILLTKERNCWNNAAQRYENSFYRNWFLLRLEDWQ